MCSIGMTTKRGLGGLCGVGVLIVLWGILRMGLFLESLRRYTCSITTKIARHLWIVTCCSMSVVWVICSR